MYCCVCVRQPRYQNHHLPVDIETLQRRRDPSVDPGICDTHLEQQKGECVGWGGVGGWVIFRLLFHSKEMCTCVFPPSLPFPRVRGGKRTLRFNPEFDNFCQLSLEKSRRAVTCRPELLQQHSSKVCSRRCSLKGLLPQSPLMKKAVNSDPDVSSEASFSFRRAELTHLFSVTSFSLSLSPLLSDRSSLSSSL